MISFVNDYSENALPEILEAMTATNLEGNPGYSGDAHSANAAAMIREKVGVPNAAVHILVGGTQTNLVAIAAFLRPHEAVITVETGHIHVHETGSIEGTGHKCLPVKGKDGKVTPEDVEAVCGPSYWGAAGILVVKPKMVYISQCTEVGTVYTKEELLALREVCDKYNLLLYCDGARLASALDCSDVTLPLLGELCDAFYIGGTKNGALFGEALVIVNDRLKEDFMYIAKQRGGVLAKGWLLGIQFETLMKDDLYERIGHTLNEKAKILREGLQALGVKFSIESPSNQLFPILPDAVLDRLRDRFAWETISKVDEAHTEIRLVTSWATKEEDIHTFLEALQEELSA